jgi:hypothetical protein
MVLCGVARAVLVGDITMNSEVIKTDQRFSSPHSSQAEISKVRSWEKSKMGNKKKRWLQLSCFFLFIPSR